MKSFRTTLLIDAPTSRVWSLLTDLPEWPRWNTTVDKVEGSIGLGSRVTVYAKASPEVRSAAAAVLDDLLERPPVVRASVGTGYGRARLPFPKERIRSET